jgi:hypothetical protein
VSTEHKTLVSVALPNGTSGREGSPVLSIVRGEGGLRLVVSGLDVSSLEAVAGPYAAQRYRSYVSARHSRGSRRR